MSQQAFSPSARRPEPPFENKRAMIFGGARGIGRAVALEFARRGADIAVADIQTALAEKTAADIRAMGGEAVALACDVTSEEAVRAAAAEAERQLGEIDIVMNNVGAINSALPEETPVSEWRRMFDINFFSAIHALAVFLPKMVARGHGHIINTASFVTLAPFAVTRLPYVASKQAIVGMTESLAVYLLPLGVQVTCFIPGPTMSVQPSEMKVFSPNLPMRGPGKHLRVHTPEETAVRLADGMRDGKILVPSHEEGWEMIKRRAASPDAYIREKIAEFASGDDGLPAHRGSAPT